MHKKSLFAFTLVEMVIAVTILSILWTIWFMFFSWYVKDGKDVKRITDISNIRKVLDIHFVEKWFLPTPDDGVQILYNGSEVWTQWVFWPEARKTVRNLDSVPKDPTTGNYYSYSLLNNTREYELATIFEGDIIWSLPHFTAQTYAAETKAYVTGTYNKKISVIRKWRNTTILALPSITASSTEDTNVENIVENGHIVVHNEEVLPATHNDNIGESISWDTVVSDVVIYDDATSNLSDEDTQKEIVEKLQNSYSRSSVITDEVSYGSLMNIDPSNEEKVESYIERLSEKSVWGMPYIR